MEAEKQWYQKPEWIYILVLLFWPVGLVLLWTNKEIPMTNKLIVSGIWLTLLILGLIMLSLGLFKEIFGLLDEFKL